MLTHPLESRRDGQGSSPRARPGRSVLPRGLCPLRIRREASPITCRAPACPRSSPHPEVSPEAAAPLWHRRTVGAQVRPPAGFPFHPRLLNQDRVANPICFLTAFGKWLVLTSPGAGAAGEELNGAVTGFPSLSRRPGRGWGAALRRPLTPQPSLAHRSSWSSAHRLESHTWPQGPARPSPPGSCRQGRPLAWAR